MSSDPAQPIVVKSTPAADQTASAVRSLLLAASTMATVLGFSHAGTLIGEAAIYAGPLGMVASLIMSQMHVLHDHNRKVTMALSAPDTVAVVK